MGASKGCRSETTPVGEVATPSVTQQQYHDHQQSQGAARGGPIVDDAHGIVVDVVFVGFKHAFLDLAPAAPFGARGATGSYAAKSVHAFLKRHKINNLRRRLSGLSGSCDNRCKKDRQHMAASN